VVHPGNLDTNISKQTAFPKFANTVLKALRAYSHAREGAYNPVFAVASPDFKAADSGEYPVLGQRMKQPRKAAQDLEPTARLWKWTEEEMRTRILPY
jgi:hypothetical protein